METNILLIEDNPGDARLILEMLKEAGGVGFAVDRADRLSTAVEKLSAQAADAVLLDLGLPDSKGLDTFSQIHSQFSEIPIIVLTVQNNEEVGMQAVRAGAQDYLVKGVISGTALTRVLRYGIERKRAEEALRGSERRYRLLFEHNMAAVLRTVGDGHIVDANQACARMLGYTSRDELLTRRVWDLWYKPEDRPAFIARLQKERALTGLELCFRRRDGTPVVVLANVTLNGGNTTEAAVIEGTMIDITDRKRAEEERMRLITAIEQCAETIIITDPNGTIQYVNPTFTKVTGYSREEAMGVNPRLLKSGKHDATYFENFWRTLLAKKPWHGEVINRRKDGSLYTDELRVAPVLDAQGEVIHFISNQLDVTERKRAEAENLRLVAAMEQAAEGIVITDLEPRIQYVNPAFTRITGYSRAEAIGQNPRILKSGKHRLRFYKEMWATILSGETWHGEVFNRRKDGTLYTEEMTITPVRDSRGVTTNFIAMKQDVTERKRAQEALIASETRYRRLFEAAQDGVLLLDSETGTITDANPFVLNLLGYRTEELLGRKLWEVGPFRDIAASQDAFRSLQKGGYVRYEDLPLEAKSGERKDVEFISNTYRSGGKQVIQCNIRDITDRKRQEDLIRESLWEKEMLLKEIHHRVKNNLQVISSLLQLRAGTIKDDALREMFRESQNRVRTMALIHEKLYRSKDFAHIDFGEYIRSLVTDLFRSYETNPEAVSFAVPDDKVLVGVDTAIPCALIVNELVSNCLKHAFPPRSGGGAGVPPSPGLADSPWERGLITVALTAGEDGKVRLVVRDNGVGFPPSVDFQHAESLGLQLVNALTEQLGGKIQMHANGGTEFQIEFLVEEAESRRSKVES